MEDEQKGANFPIGPEFRSDGHRSPGKPERLVFRDRDAFLFVHYSNSNGQRNSQSETAFVIVHPRCHARHAVWQILHIELVEILFCERLGLDKKFLARDDRDPEVSCDMRRVALPDLQFEQILSFQNGNTKFQIPIRMSPKILSSSVSFLSSFPISAVILFF
jgi:hypothetical protein